MKKNKILNVIERNLIFYIIFSLFVYYFNMKNDCEL